MLPFEKENSILKKLEPSLRIKPDEELSVWQEKARKKLVQLLGLDLYESTGNALDIEYDKTFDDFREIRFTVETERDLKIPCHLLVPRNTSGDIPLMICLQGHSTGMHISLGRPKFEGDEDTIAGDRDFALQCVEQGFCALAMEQRGFGEMGGTPETHCHEPSMAALLSGRTMMGARVWDVSRVIDCAIENFGSLFDKNKIYCMGNSGGGTATFYAAAVDTRIKAAMPSCAFCTFADSIGGMYHCQCNFVPNVARYFDMSDVAGLIAPRPLVIVSGQLDKIFPIDFAKSEFAKVEELYYEKSGENKKCVHFVGEKGHRFYRDAWNIFKGLL